MNVTLSTIKIKKYMIASINKKIRKNDTSLPKYPAKNNLTNALWGKVELSASSKAGKTSY